MKLLTCPINGPRPVSEFAYAGEVRPTPDPDTCTDDEWADYPDATLTWTTSEVGVAASGDLAYEHGYWTSDPDGEGLEPEMHGEYLTVWKKIDGQWKALYDAGTMIKPEEEPEIEEPS